MHACVRRFLIRQPNREIYYGPHSIALQFDETLNWNNVVYKHSIMHVGIWTYLYVE